MRPEKDVQQSYDQMAIVEKYETVIAYLYPIAQNIGRRHGVAKVMFIECLLEQVKLIIEAGKSGQVSRLYIADAGLAHLRFWLRFLSSGQVRGLTPHQVETAQVLIAEVGRLLGAWIAKQKGRG
ncbi:MAG: diversity-generating retroelement protein Avd [Hydrogenophilales bacterium]|nr:diversity-generating retroelement protein Avd [Hydrogenophilales bacterium]